MTDSTTSAEWAVFHGCPDQSALQDLVSSAAEPERSHYVWLLGVCQAALGLYAAALDTIAGVEIEAEYSMISSLRASILRQLGCHDLALPEDDRALSTAATPGVAIEALTGLAADHVGLADPTGAAANLARAEELLMWRSEVDGERRWWRHLVRFHWVSAEISLLRGDAADALTHAQESLRIAEAAAAPRHIAKSLLFVAVGLMETGDRERAESMLSRSLNLAESMHAASLTWPIHVVLANLAGEQDSELAGSHLAAARGIADGIRDGLPADLAQRWDDRADIRALHSGV